METQIAEWTNWQVIILIVEVALSLGLLALVVNFLPMLRSDEVKILEDDPERMT